MVFFALTRSGYEDFERHFGTHAGVSLWVNKDVLSDAELVEVREADLLVTGFTRTIDILDNVAVDEAIDTIKQHHPNECVWLER
jgi:hypothetical protein